MLARRAALSDYMTNYTQTPENAAQRQAKAKVASEVCLPHGLPCHSQSDPKPYLYMLMRLAEYLEIRLANTYDGILPEENIPCSKYQPHEEPYGLWT